MTTGTIIGDSRIAITSPLPRKLARVRPSAASVPRTVAKAADDRPMMKLFLSARIHCTLLMNSWYQRSERPSNG